MDSSCTCGPQRRSRRAHRCARRVHVVDEHDRRRHVPRGGDERAAHVAPSLRPGQPRLLGDRAVSSQQRHRVERPEPAELLGQPTSRMVAAPRAPISVGRDIRDDVCRRPRNDLGDELGSEGRERAEAALLPRADERPRDGRVRDRRPRGGEREPPAGALAAALDRPGRGRAAAGAERRDDPDERAPADLARERARPPTAGAASGEEQVDEPLRPRYGRTRDVSVSALCQICAGSSAYSSRTGRPTRSRHRLSATRSWPRSPMSNQGPSNR